MDILKILKENGKDLYLQELDYFVTELKTGDYSSKYIEECMIIINTLKNLKNNNKANPINNQIKGDFNDVILNPSSLQIGSGQIKPSNSIDLIKYEIENIRKNKDYIELFKDYVLNNSLLDETLIDNLFKFFLDWEIDELLSIKSFSEQFLEKYFAELDHAKIAHYQFFSEEFFMKHFNDLSYSTVLQKGVNEWRKKSNRSSKLNVFLRLKGVNI